MSKHKFQGPNWRRFRQYDNHTTEEINMVAAAAQRGEILEVDPFDSTRHDIDAGEVLANMMRPYVIALLDKILGDYTNDRRGDMAQAAWVGVWKALDHFSPDIAEKTGARFSTYAWRFIQHEITAWLAENSGAVPLPRSAWQNSRALEVEWNRLHPDRDILRANPEELRAIRIGGGEHHRPGNPEAIAARQAPFQHTSEDWDNPSPAAEAILFAFDDEAEDKALGEALVLVVEALRELPEEERYEAADQFADNFGLPLGTAEVLVAQAGF